MIASGEYKLLTTPEEIASAKNLGDAWKNPEIPMRHWRAIEDARILASLGKAAEVPPFKAFLEAAFYINGRELNETLDILDVGAASGYYGELIRIYGPEWYYTACDYNPGFQELARKYLPRIRFDIADGRDLPYANKTFDVVMAETSAVHPDEWAAVIAECARVASKYVILNRTFIVNDGPTKVFRKTAYDVSVVETWCNRKELENICTENKLEIIKEFVVAPEYPQLTFVCGKK